MLLIGLDYFQIGKLDSPALSAAAAAAAIPGIIALNFSTMPANIIAYAQLLAISPPPMACITNQASAQAYRATIKMVIRYPAPLIMKYKSINSETM